MTVEGQSKKRKIDLDWSKLLSRKDEEPPQIEIDGESRAGRNKPTPSALPTMHCNGRSEMTEPLQCSDAQLDEWITRQRNLLETMAAKLPDKGDKIRETIKLYEDEKERRRLIERERDVDMFEKPRKSKRFCTAGSSDGSGVDRKSSQSVSQSAFGASFCRKMEEENTGCDIVNINAFDEELQTLNRCGRLEGQSSSGQSNLKHPKKISLNGGQCGYPNGVHCSSFYSAREVSDDSLNQSPGIRKNSSKSNGSRSRKEQTVVLVDDEEQQVLNAVKQEPKLPECDKDARLYYPSRDHPESVEIRFADLDCLAPGAYLTSPVMNFYIQYLRQQASPTNRAICDCHFFNTYFYKKLKEDVSFKGNGKSYFSKFRRWWKGINIFQKAYILIPVHEDLHWSLVIICIPDKEDESGPIMLHFDSLELHCPGSVFQNIKSFLSEEWNYLSAEETPSDLTIPEKIWKNLPRRIERRKISVPQQKNDYDCGLFVLFFMERFIEEAPERLKKKDLAMFGKKWFRPEEASSLRVKILNILGELFQNVS